MTDKEIPSVNALAARPPTYADGSHIRKARIEKRHLNTKSKHSRVIEKHTTAKHNLGRG